MNSPQSVTRVIHILEALCANPEALSLAQLSRILQAPKSSLAALLRGLTDADFVTLADGVYRLGPRAFGIGSALLEARRRLQSSDLVRAGMQRLAQRTGETVLFAVRDAGVDNMTYVEVIESRNTVRFAVSAGDRRPLYCTAGGRALLAAEPPDVLRSYLKQLKPKALTAHTETSKQRLSEIIAAVRESGVAQTVSETADGAAGTASVICDASGTVIGALIVAAPTTRQQLRHEELARLVQEEATAISANLGYRKQT